MVDDAKKHFFKNKIEEHKSDTKKLWATLKTLGTKDKPKTKNENIGLMVNGSVTFDKASVAENFNSFFTNIANDLVQKLPASTGEYGENQVNIYYEAKGIGKEQFCFSQVTNATVAKILIGLDAAKATGLDAIPAIFLRDGADVIAPYVTHIINLSISQAKVPHDFKKARVTALHKKGRRDEVSNYRPVSILSILSKIFERVIHEQISNYVNQFDILYDLQSGFRQAHSTESCLLYLTDLIKREVDNGKYCGMVMLDLQKAFDTVNHQILLYKLKAMGFKREALALIQSYLSDRSQMVETGGVLSEPKNITCGVPQGSIIGPLLFLLYINDMDAACSCPLFLYADDSALLVTGESLEAVSLGLENELKKVNRWLSENKLSLHLGKSECIVFATRYNLRQTANFKVECNGVKLQEKTSISYLGCILEQNMSGEQMALSVISKIHARTKFLARIAKFLDRPTMRTLASALVQCLFDYTCLTWYSGISKNIRDKLQTSQNKLMRVVIHLSPRTHIGANHFRELNWLPVEGRIRQLRLIMVYKSLKGQCPKYLKGYFQYVNQSHSVNTRASIADLKQQNLKRKIGRSSFKYTG